MKDEMWRSKVVPEARKVLHDPDFSWKDVVRTTMIVIDGEAKQGLRDVWLPRTGIWIVYKLRPN